MDKENRILELLQELQYKELELNNLTYGSVEVRKKNNNKYLYTHHKLDGKTKTYYIGEYSEDLYNSLSYNNELAKQLKKSIRKIADEDAAILLQNAFPTLEKYIDHVHTVDGVPLKVPTDLQNEI